MDVFVKNSTIESGIQEFCSKALYNQIIDIFGTRGWIIDDERFELTTPMLFGVTVHSVWRIDDFIHETQLPLKDKLKVLMSYIECGGCVLWGKENYSGRYFVPFLQRLVVEKYIDDETNARIFFTWSNYRNGKTEKPYFDVSE